MGFFTRKKDRIDELMRKGLEFLDSALYIKRGRRSDCYDPKSPDFDLALNCFDEVLKIDPTLQTALYYRGVSLYHKEEYLEAIKSFNKAIERNQSSQVWIYRGRAFNKLENNEEALVSFNKALELNPDDPDNVYSICELYARVGQFNQTISIIDQFLSNHPNSAITWFRKGNFLEAFGQDKEAFGCYKKSFELNPVDITIEGRINFKNGKVGPLYLLDVLKSEIEDYKNKQTLMKEIDKKLILDEPNIIGKYWCSFFSFGKPINLVFKDWIDSTRKVEFFDQELPSSIVVLTKEKIVIVEYFGSKDEKISLIPLESIISIDRLKDVYGFEYIFLLRYGKKELYFRINKDSNAFYDNVIKTIKMRRESINQPTQKHVHIDFSSIKEYLKNGGVVMQTFKCPGCGASLNFPDKDDSTTCQYCGNNIKAVDLFEKIKSLL